MRVPLYRLVRALSKLRERERAVLVGGILVAWAVLLHPLWFLSLQPATSGDWGFINPETAEAWIGPPTGWRRDLGFGSLNFIGLAFYPFRAAFGLLSLIGASYGLSERLLFFWPSALLPLFGMYYLARCLGAGRSAAILGALVFGTNSYILLIQRGQLTVAMAYGFAPWILGTYFQGLQDGKKTMTVLSGAILSVSFFFEPRISLITSALLVLWTAFMILASRGGAKEIAPPSTARQGWPPDCDPASEGGLAPGTSMILQRPLRQLTTLSVVLGITLTLNAYWILPVMLAGGSAVRAALPDDPWVSWMNIEHALLLSHPFWTGAEPAIFTKQVPPPLSLVLPVVAFYAFLLRRRPIVASFGLVAILGVFLVKQENPPFGALYGIAFDVIPGFNLYREASKFYLLVALSYGALISIAITESLRSAMRKQKVLGLKDKWRLSRPIVLVALIIVVLGHHAYPASTGQLGGVSQPVSLPPEVETVNQMLLSDLSDVPFYRTFWWPTFQRFGVWTDRMPALSGVAVAGNQMAFLVSEGRQALKLFENPGTGPYFDLAAIRYLVVPHDPLDEIYPRLGPKERFVQDLDSQDWLTEVTPSPPTAKVFKNQDALPYVYAVNASLDALSSMPIVAIRENATTMPFELEEVGAKLLLEAGRGVRTIVLAETYDPGWELRCESGHKVSSQNLLGFNAFEISLTLTSECSASHAIQQIVLGGVAISVAGGLGLAIFILGPRLWRRDELA